MITIGQSSQTAMNPERAPAVRSQGRLAYRVMLAGAVVLAATGIGTFVLGRAPMTSWVLMAHVAVAPLFAIGLAGVALTWADHCRFGDARSGQGALTKVLFWLTLACGLVVLLSGVLPMTPLFGTRGQHLLYLTHRYSGIGLAAAVGLHWLGRRRGRDGAPTARVERSKL